MQPHAILEFREEDFDRHPVANLARRDLAQVRDEPGPLFECDQRHDHRIAGGVDRGMARNDIAINGPASAGPLDP